MGLSTITQFVAVNGRRGSGYSQKSTQKEPTTLDSPVSPKRSFGNQPCDMEANEEPVTIRMVRDGDDRTREVCISCTDATGLGCDVARLLLDFGLVIVSGDWHTDGEWCFVIIIVRLAPRMPAHWRLLRSRLLDLCPKHLWINSWRPPNPADVPVPFLLQVSSYDRYGVLHDLMHTLWEADVSVFKAHITTSPSHDVLDMFWLYDNRHQLPDHHRVLEISDQVRQVLGQSVAECTITPAPDDSSYSNSFSASAAADAGSSALSAPRPCKDATATSPLSGLMRKGGGNSKASSASSLATLLEEAGDEWGAADKCDVTLDNATTDVYTCLHVTCPDRKGLVYDLMRTIKDVHLRVAFARVAVRSDGLCDTELFVQHVNGGRIIDRDDQDTLHSRVLAAVAIPVRIAIREICDRTVTEIVVTSDLDSGGRGRPRVTYDVTEALNTAKLCVFMADIYVEAASEGEAGDQRPQERHRFLVNRKDGSCLSTPEQKRELYAHIRAQLAGTAPPRTARNKPPTAAHNGLGGGYSNSSSSAGAQQRRPRGPVQQDGRDIIDSLAKWSWYS